MKTLHKEPLLHFLIIGALIFVLFALRNEGEKLDESSRIVVTTADIERLSDNW